MVVTTQTTAKKFKLQSIISVLLMIVGFCWLIVLLSVPDAMEPGDLDTPTWLVMIGVGWYLVNRFRIWWHHR